MSFALAMSLPALVLVWRLDLAGYAALSRLQVAAGWLIVLAMLLLVFVLLRTLGWGLHALAERALRRPPAIGLHRWHAPWLTNLAVVLAVVLASLGIINGLRTPVVRERQIVLANLPAQFDGLRIAVLADLHASPVKGRARTEAIVARTLAARPDMIVLPGDMVDGPLDVSAPMVAPLVRLQAPLGVWLAPGNHEGYHGYQDWMDYFRGLGLGVLENQSTLIERDGARLAVSGLGDLSAEKPRARALGVVAPDLQAVLAASAGADVHVLLAHQPKLARRVAASGRVDLQLSGHTHGGHILGMDRWLVAPFNDGFVRGRYKVGDMTLYVAPGVGQWDGFTARLGVPQAIDVLVLRQDTVHP
jgi:predicted MPP superfamily phosphohydrolase